MLYLQKLQEGAASVLYLGKILACRVLEGHLEHLDLLHYRKSVVLARHRRLAHQAVLDVEQNLTWARHGTIEKKNRGRKESAAVNGVSSVSENNMGKLVTPHGSRIGEQLTPFIKSHRHVGPTAVHEI